MDEITLSAEQQQVAREAIDEALNELDNRLNFFDEDWDSEDDREFEAAIEKLKPLAGRIDGPLDARAVEALLEAVEYARYALEHQFNAAGSSKAELNSRIRDMLKLSMALGLTDLTAGQQHYFEQPGVLFIDEINRSPEIG